MHAQVAEAFHFFAHASSGSFPLLCTRRRRQLSTPLHAQAAVAFHFFARAGGGSFPLLCTHSQNSIFPLLCTRRRRQLSTSLHARTAAAFHFSARAGGGSVPLLCARRQRNIPLLCTRRQRQLTLMGLLWHPCVLFGTLGPLAAHSHVSACSFLLSHFFTRSRAFVRTHTWHLCVLFGFTNLARLSTPARSLARLCLFPPVVTPLHTFTRFRTHSHTFAKI